MMGENIFRRGLRKKSWISFLPKRIGGHAKDAAKHGDVGIVGSYKVKVIDFRLNLGMKLIVVVHVQHAYMRRQLDLDPNNTSCECCMQLYVLKFKPLNFQFVLFEALSI